LKRPAITLVRNSAMDLASKGTLQIKPKSPFS